MISSFSLVPFKYAMKYSPVLRTGMWAIKFGVWDNTYAPFPPWWEGGISHLHLRGKYLSPDVEHNAHTHFYTF